MARKRHGPAFDAFRHRPEVHPALGGFVASIQESSLVCVSGGVGFAYPLLDSHLFDL